METNLHLCMGDTQALSVSVSVPVIKADGQ